MKPKIALCQLLVSKEKKTNLVNAESAIEKSASQGANIIVLPECWNGPYATDQFRSYAETIPSPFAANPDPVAEPSSSLLSRMAAKHRVVIVGGSIPEKAQSAIYNTCGVYSPEGKLIAKHRKVHLFDIDIPGKMTFKESATLSPGQSVTTFDTAYGKMGLGICYDMRFPEYAQLLSQEGCKVLIYPGAFNTTTGPLHWELLIRGRANDNQLFVAACSPARDPAGGYQAWGHSTIVSPWAKVLATTGHDADIVMAELDLSEVDTVRAQIPTSKQKRADLYKLSKL